VTEVTGGILKSDHGAELFIGADSLAAQHVTVPIRLGLCASLHSSQHFFCELPHFTAAKTQAECIFNSRALS
jgi:hypothetical protein